MLSFKKFISENQWGVDNKYMKHSVEKLRSMKDKLETTIGNLKRQHSTKTSLGGKNPRAEEIKELENNLRMLRSAMQAKMRKEEVELDEAAKMSAKSKEWYDKGYQMGLKPSTYKSPPFGIGGAAMDAFRKGRKAGEAAAKNEEVELDEGKLDKSSPIYKEYEALKKKSVADLRNTIGRSHRVADLKGYDKAGAIRQILDDKYGEKKVDAFFGFSEEVELAESHFKVGDKVKCIHSGKEGVVTKVDPSEKGKYYTVKRNDGEVMQYAPDDLAKAD